MNTACYVILPNIIPTNLPILLVLHYFTKEFEYVFEYLNL